MMMVHVPLHCPFCGTEKVTKNGTSNGISAIIGSCNKSGTLPKFSAAVLRYRLLQPRLDKLLLTLDSAAVKLRQTF